ncbi:MAG: LysR family transcriptional regulator [Eubacteriaceae bacterium]
MRQFKVIAEQANITKAAELLYISQPALSKTLRNIEKELACVFFNRVGRNIELNENGKKLLKHINEILIKVDELYFEFTSVENAENTSVKTSLFDLYFFEPILQSYKRLNPDIKNEVSYKNSYDAISSFIHKECDIIIFDDIDVNPDILESFLNNKQINTTLLFKDSLYISAPHNKKFDNLNKVDIKQLKDDIFVRVKPSEPKSWGTLKFCNHVCEKENIHINYIHEFDISESESITYKLKYLKLVPSLAISYYKVPQHRKKFIKLTNPSAQRNIYISYYMDNEYVNKMGDFIKKEFYRFFNK